MQCTTSSLKIALENGVVLPGVVFKCLRVQIPCVGNATLGKLSLIHDHSVRCGCGLSPNHTG
jgi:hypothetical protein